MTKQEAIEELRACAIDKCYGCDGISEIGCDKKCGSLQALDIAIECIEKCLKFGSCKECNSADFCYNHPDVCFCLRHERTMYADDTCNYFYERLE